VPPLIALWSREILQIVHYAASMFYKIGFGMVGQGHGFVKQYRCFWSRGGASDVDLRLRPADPRCGMAA
jgi:hypothetical protein